MQSEPKKNYKELALNHVRNVCPELRELSFGCVVKTKNSHWQFQVVRDCSDDRWLCFELDKRTVSYLPEHNIEIIGHTPHLEHWLRGIEHLKGESYQKACRNELLEVYNLTKDEQSEEFYKAYVEIVGV